MPSADITSSEPTIITFNVVSRPSESTAPRQDAAAGVAERRDRDRKRRGLGVNPTERMNGTSWLIII
jgi:hypothetical protein